MFDTVRFNRVLDGIVPVERWIGHVRPFAPHIQRDEINNTKNEERRAELARVFREIVIEPVPVDALVLGVFALNKTRLEGTRVVPTTAMVAGVSRAGAARSSDGTLYGALKRHLDSLNHRKPNNVQDALIAATAISLGLVLVTDDRDLKTVTSAHCGQVATPSEAPHSYRRAIHERVRLPDICLHAMPGLEVDLRAPSAQPWPHGNCEFPGMSCPECSGSEVRREVQSR